MPNASLPVNLDSDLTNLNVSYSSDDGVAFSLPDSEVLDILTLLRCRVYWVDGGGTSPLLPEFQPTQDSVILRTAVNFDLQICHPVPKYITIENIDRAFFESRCSAIVMSMLPDWLQDLLGDIADFLVEVFTNGLGIWCEAGELIGIASSLSTGNRVGFKMRTWSEQRRGQRKELIYPHVYLHQLRFVEETIPTDNPVLNILPYGISHQVGEGADSGVQASDVHLVKQRLVDLGFALRPTPPKNKVGAWPGGAPPDLITMVVNDDNNDETFHEIIRLFQSITRGHRTLRQQASPHHSLAGVDGRIDKRGATEKWLWAGNAPVWQHLPDRGPGFENTDDTTLDPNNPALDHDYGTNYLVDALRKGGRKYLADVWRGLSETQRTNNVILRTNDASYATGGDTGEHTGHETGIDIDLRLPPTDDAIRGVTINTGNYSSATARAICNLFSGFDNVSAIYFNDATIYSGPNEVDKVSHQPDHHHHIHVSVDPPATAHPWDDGLANATQ